MIGGALGILGAIVGVAALFTFLGSNNTNGILQTIFNGFKGSLSVAMGNKGG